MDTPNNAADVDQRQVNIEVNVNNQADGAGPAQQPRRQRQRNIQRQRARQGRRRGGRRRNDFRSVTQRPDFRSVTQNPDFRSVTQSPEFIGGFQDSFSSATPAPADFPQIRNNQNPGISPNFDMPTLSRSEFRNTFGARQNTLDRVNPLGSVPIGAETRNPPNPFGGRNEPIRRISNAQTNIRRGNQQDIPTFAGSFSDTRNQDLQGAAGNSLNNFRPQIRTQQSNNLVPQFSSPLDPLRPQTDFRNTNIDTGQGAPQRGRSRVRSRRPQTRVFQPQAVINDAGRTRDFNTLPPLAVQPMVPVDSFNQIQRQPQLLNPPVQQVVAPTVPTAVRVPNQQVAVATAIPLPPKIQFVDPRSGNTIRTTNLQDTSLIQAQQPASPTVQTTDGGIPVPVPPFVQPVTEQTGAPTILNSQTSNVIQAQNIPSLPVAMGPQNIAVDINNFQSQNQRNIAGQTSLNLAEVPLEIANTSINIINQGVVDPLFANKVNQTFSQTNIQGSAVATSITGSGPIAVEAMGSQITPTGQTVDVGTPIPIVVQQAAGATLLPGTINIISDRNASLPAEIGIADVVPTAGVVPVTPTIVADPAPVVIDMRPNINIVTDPAIEPPTIPVDPTVKIPAIQTPDQVALVPLNTPTDAIGVSVNMSTGTIDLNAAETIRLPSGPPPPVLPRLGGNSQIIDPTVQTQADMQPLPDQNLNTQIQINSQAISTNEPQVDPGPPRPIPNILERVQMQNPLVRQALTRGTQQMMEVPVKFGE